MQNYLEKVYDFLLVSLPGQIFKGGPIMVNRARHSRKVSRRRTEKIYLNVRFPSYRLINYDLAFGASDFQLTTFCVVVFEELRTAASCGIGFLQAFDDTDHVLRPRSREDVRARPLDAARVLAGTHHESERR